ncbi:phosphoadenosine phosphosulfate reductase family protein [Carboxydocella sp. ULO1]|uniref:phosphoadenosine phosphosulfate reductase domain-containing protein n=1 Tax=Carboxydocella sp. ULO1 TaxID=1926599 RepID=UPI0009CBF7BB|nr:phosphoadenosine phosphosulfate reductase family protein [Carboxydocella sp. ULO1]GAW28760.1 PAPS reductase/FAD synthetase family protein [Carboxydocella sp. ULO1]
MKIFWCETCNIPVFDENCSLCGSNSKYFAMDIRPVFPEETILIEILLQKRGEFLSKVLWNTKGNKYFFNGKKVDFSMQKLIHMSDPKLIIEKMNEEILRSLETRYEYFIDSIEKFIRANRSHLQRLEYESIEFIKNVSEKYSDRIKMVSFSGGKDSTVVSSLVRRALGTNNILHVFGDTTLEFPMTYEYIQRFRRNNRKIPFFRPRSHHNFLDLCDTIGPPSRVMRWCCTVFKTGPISSLIDKFSGNKNILTFYGVRRSESIRRSKYDEVSKSPKIAKQIVASPIINWKDADVWLYLLSNEEDFNDAYRLGFTRVGCWCCPSNSDWSFFLAKIFIPEHANEWKSFLVSFAKTIGKPDPENYVEGGFWKARQGGNGMDVSFSNIKFEPCANEENARNFYLTRPIYQQLYEYFKPFGHLNFDMGKKLLNEVYVLDRKTKELVLILQGKLGQNHLKIIVPSKQNYRLISTRIDCQLRKFQSCIGCGGCPAICNNKAISIIGDQYYIDSKKCTGCMECIAYYDRGCLVTKVTQTRRSE